MKKRQKKKQAKRGFDSIRKPVAPPGKVEIPKTAFNRRKIKKAARVEIERAMQE